MSTASSLSTPSTIGAQCHRLMKENKKTKSDEKKTINETKPHWNSHPETKESRKRGKEREKWDPHMFQV